MSVFICPVCGEKLSRDEHRLFCRNGHSFDLSAEGYTHLLPANRMNSKIPGDSAEMAASRTAFLNKGYYEPLKNKLCELVLKEAKSKTGFTLLDCGCGEGYYTAGIAEALYNADKTAVVAGFDISRPSVKRAAKRCKTAEFAVASIFNIPAACSSCDAVLNVFSPLCESEYLRVLKTGGIYIYVVPGARHLWQLKEALYEKPYENSEHIALYEGFSAPRVERLRYETEVRSNADIEALFKMTPYYWKTSAKGAERLEALESLRTEVAFDIHIFKKL